jgi:hypothetical protein
MLQPGSLFPEALFRTMKYWPAYPRGGFENVEAARAWVTAFVDWYNTTHLHSGIGFVTPCERHDGRADAILARRRKALSGGRTQDGSPAAPSLPQPRAKLGRERRYRQQQATVGRSLARTA